ncbi:MAG: outer membrane lipoprotein chaperone LolA [Sulfuricaulis sp.]|uniref:outer membrane lipoprotein chaperone LolA n=1 Tax=Sulfuricaulis sp. TaxID=2003553 RepID=UPI0034A3992B
MTKTHLMLAFLLVLGIAPVSEAGKAKTGTDSLHRFFKEVHSISARFTQVVMDESRQPIQESSGTLWIQRPNKFRWDYESPYQQEIVADGKRIWVYDAGLRQVTVRPLTNGLADTPAMLLAGKGRLEDNFRINPLDEKDDLEWMLLTPRRKDSGYQNIRMAFLQGKLRVMEMIDGLGHTTRMTFEAARENTRIDPDRFTFTPPPGVDVVGGQEAKAP